jgi:hypothetical protein
MMISVHTRGGVFGVDRTVDVRDGLVTVTEHGKTREVGQLDPARLAQLSELADRVARLEDPVQQPAPEAVDAASTAIEIDDGERQRAVQLQSGVDAPNEGRLRLPAGEGGFDLIDVPPAALRRRKQRQVSQDEGRPPVVERAGR